MCNSLILLIIAAFFAGSSTLPPGITMDIEKGIVFERVGYYSEKIEEEIFHVFIPFNNICLETGTSDICQYVKSIDNHFEEVDTITSVTSQMASVYDQQSIATITRKDLRHILENYDVDKFLNIAKSSIYYINNNFYLTSPMLSKDHDETIESRPMTQISIVLEQIKNRKIGYDFLTQNQTTELFSMILSNNSQATRMISSAESNDIFMDMIIGQSVFVMKSCSISHQDNKQSAFDSSSSSSLACLAISTLIRNFPRENSIVYDVFRSTPLPVVIDGHVYVYENIPKLFAFNPLSNDVLIWDYEDMDPSCLKSRIISCEFHPIVMALSNFPCLAELISEEYPTISKCRITTTKNLQMNVLNVANRVWTFFSPQEPFLCRISASITAGTQSILIRPPMLVILPCDQKLKCSTFELPTSPCIDHSIYVKQQTNVTLIREASISISLANMTDRLLAVHERASRQSLIQLENDMIKTKTMIDKYLEEFIAASFSALSLFVLSVALILVKVIKKKTIEKLDKIQIEMNRLQRDCVLSV